MSKYTFLSLSAILVIFSLSSSCSEKKEDSICKCITAGDELNKYSVKLLQNSPNAEDEKKMKHLKSEKEKLCKKFQMMSGTEMLERKKTCKN